ncbi:MAG: FapA family protein [Negativicutes bacterium]|nr:FapA family protein [Negativicutes bacterium]
MADNENISGQTDQQPPVDGTFKVEIKEDGVFLTVSPPKNGGTPVTETTVVNDLKSRDIKDFNFGQVIRTAKEASGNPTKVSEKSTADLAEPEIQVLVDRERMEATLTIVMPKNSRPLAIQEVHDKIHAAGVLHGIDRESIQRAYDRPGLQVTCAKGDPAVDGTSASIQYSFDLSKKGQPVELPDGRVDFKDLNLYTVVAEGDVLAEKIPPTPGTTGTDVLGQPAFAKPGKDILLPAGKNVYVEDNKVIAGIAGQMQIINNKIHVSPVIEIKGDVDLSTGNIEFVGNVVIRGSVQAGFSVKADGNIEIHGSVSGGTVDGKNVLIRMGIQGMQRGYVKAKETVATKFIENANVSADGDIMVTDTILHSRVHAGKKVLVEGKRGFIAGGHVMATEEIRAKIVGTHLAVATDLEVGVNPEIRDEYQRIRKELKQAENNLDQAQKTLLILKRFDQSELPPDKREMLLKLTKQQFLLAGQVDTMRRRITEIELIFEEARYGRIRVSDVVYPGVKIVMGPLVKPIRESHKYVSFFSEEGEIKIGSFR